MHERYMELALELAYKGKNRVSQNPMIGAVIVKDSKIIGQGYSMENGKEYAEINAINNSSEDVAGATLYVTLEPCSYYGNKTLCTDTIINSKISKVVIGYIDPNRKMCGKSVKKLIDNDIEIVVGVLEEECKKLNEAFKECIPKRKPFVIMETIMPLDKAFATSSDKSNAISSKGAKKEENKLRSEVNGIMVSVNTIINNNSDLIDRTQNSKNPVRIIVDSSLKIPLDSRVANTTDEARTIIATLNNNEKEKIELLKSKGVEILITEEKDNTIDLNYLIAKLGHLEIDSILLEGESSLKYSALEAGIVDKVHIHMPTNIIDKEIFIEGYVKKN